MATDKRFKRDHLHVRRLVLTDPDSLIAGAYLEDDSSGNLKLVNAAGTAVTLSATELGYLDGLTIGTVTASKALVVDANKDLATLRHLTISGNLVTGATTLSETDLAKIDGITNGTIAASKAVVVDANKVVAGLAGLTLDSTAVLTKTSAYPLVAADSGRHFDNTGAGGSVTFTLPAVASSNGFTAYFHCVVDQEVVIAAPAGTLVGPNNAGRTTATLAGAGQRIGVDIFAFCNGAKWFLHVDTKGLTAPTYA